MRLTILLCCCILLIKTACAQDTIQHRLIYAGFRGQFSGMSGGKLSGSIVLGKRHELTIAAETYTQEARYKPADYFCWECGPFKEKEHIYGGSVGYGYILYPPFLQGFSRIILRGGILIGQQQIPVNYKHIPGRSSDEDNYTHDIDHHPALALMLNPTMDVALGRVVGLSIGAYGVYNKDFAATGISFGLIIGSVAKSKPVPLQRKPKPAASAVGN